MAESDILVTGFKEIQNVNVAAELRSKLTLLIKDIGITASNISEFAIIYDSNQNLNALLNRVVGI
ncbi:MAG: hypothetical protein JRN20_08085 [Nitrososphaerota archaeon]|nr:hypothetical protein [Nitrososphaerota archaeon]